ELMVGITTLISSRRETIDTIAGVLDCEIVEENTRPLRRQSSNKRSKRARVVLDDEESDDWTLEKSGEENGNGEYEYQEKNGIGVVKEMKENEEDEEMQDVEYDDSDSGFQPSDSQAPASSSTLVKEIRSVSSSIVKNKWRPLDPASKRFVNKLLRNSVPAVLAHVNGTSWRTKLQTELDKLIMRISKSLDTVTVPKATSETSSLDYKKLSSHHVYFCLIIVFTETDQIKQMEMQLEKEKQLLKEESEFLKSLQSAKKSVDSRNRSLQRSKLHPLLKEVEDPDDLVDVDNDLIKQYLTHVTTDVPLTSPSSPDPLSNLKLSLSSHLRSVDAHTSIIDPVIDGVYEAERQIWRLMNESGLGEKVFDVLRDR
ncbi:9031_t:CDS:2, partial [Paraglomus occultum]